MTPIELAGRREIKAAKSDLWKAADDADAAVRAAAQLHDQVNAAS